MINSIRYTITIKKNLLEHLKAESERTNTPIARIIDRLLTNRYIENNRFQLIQITPHQIKPIGSVTDLSGALTLANLTTSDTGIETFIVDTKYPGTSPDSNGSSIPAYPVLNRHGEPTTPAFAAIIDALSKPL